MFGKAFKPRAHYVYDYKPRYYDERKERLQQLKDKYKNKDKAHSTSDLPTISLSKENLKSSWTRHKKASSNRSVNIRLAVIIAILVGLVAYFFELHKLF